MYIYMTYKVIYIYIYITLYVIYKCQNICIKKDIYLFKSYTSVSSKPSKTYGRRLKNTELGKIIFPNYRSVIVRRRNDKN